MGVVGEPARRWRGPRLQARWAGKDTTSAISRQTLSPSPPAGLKREGPRRHHGFTEPLNPKTGLGEPLIPPPSQQKETCGDTLKMSRGLGVPVNPPNRGRREERGSGQRNRNLSQLPFHRRPPRSRRQQSAEPDDPRGLGERRQVATRVRSGLPSRRQYRKVPRRRRLAPRDAYLRERVRRTQENWRAMGASLEVLRWIREGTRLQRE